MFIGFDLESAHEYKEGVGLEEVGISCAACYAVEFAAPQLFAAKDIFGFAKPEMDAYDGSVLAKALIDYANNGDIIVTFNGLHFDWPVLASVCNDTGIEKELKDVAINHHIDIGFCMVIDRGFMVSLNTAAHGLGLSGKTEGMKGSLAPLLWNPERELTEEELVDVKALGVMPGTKPAQDLCLTYVGQDSVTTADVYRLLVEDTYLQWTSSRSGRLVKTPWYPSILDGRLLKVCEIMDKEQCPTPWWPENPFCRDEMLSWALS